MRRAYTITAVVRRGPNAEITLETVPPLDSREASSVKCIVLDAPPGFEAAVGTAVRGDGNGLLSVGGVPFLKREAGAANRLRLVAKPGA